MSRAAQVVTSFPFRLLVTAGLLAAIALTIDWGEVVDRLADGNWGWFAAGVAALVAGLSLGCVRWHWLLSAAGLPLSVWQTARAYSIGVFANNFLPTGFGGDAARGFLVARGGEALARSFTSVFVDRASSIVCLLLLALGAIVVDPGAIPGELSVTIVVVCLAGTAAGIAAVAISRTGRPQRLLPERVRPYASLVAGILGRYARDRRLVVLVVSIGVVFQALIVASVWMLARSLDLDLPYALVAVVLPLVLIAILLPVSIAGFGVREGGFVVLLGTVGVSAADATLLSLFTVASIAIASLPGAVALLTSGNRASLAAEPVEGGSR